MKVTKAKGLQSTADLTEVIKMGAASLRLAVVLNCPTCHGAGMLRTGGGALVLVLFSFGWV
jgi:hypothetical protein